MQRGSSRLSGEFNRFVLFVLLLALSPAALAAQGDEPLDLIYRGEFDELGWEKSDLLHVGVVITVRGGCQIDEARAEEFDASAYVSAWGRLVADDPDLANTLGYAFHPTARRLGTWLAEAGALDCSDDVWQQLLLNAARYVIAYEENQPTAAEVVETQTDAWWAKLEMVRAAEEVARWDRAGWVRHQVGTDLDLQNRDDVIASLAEKLASLPAEQIQRCPGMTLRVLLDAEGRVVDVFERNEASGYSSHNSDSRAQSLWESSRDRCGAQLPIVKEAVRSMEFRPATTPEGLDVPIWFHMLVDMHRRLQPFGISLQTHSWTWRFLDGEILSGNPWRLEPYRFDSGRQPPPVTASVPEEPRDTSASAEQLEALKAQGPSLTPFTVEPRITNPDSVRAAIERHYPPLLRAQEVGGTVQVWLLVDTNGTVADARLVQGSGQDAGEDPQRPPGFERNPVEDLPPPPGGSGQPPSEPQNPLEAAALEVAAVMEFSPARNGSTPVAMWIQRTITFEP